MARKKKKPSRITIQDVALTVSIFTLLFVLFVEFIIK